MADEFPGRVLFEETVEEVFKLQDELSTAKGERIAAIQAEIEAKNQFLNRLYISREDWMLGRLEPSVAALKTLAASEEAKQARLVYRIRETLKKHGIALPPQQSGADETGSTTDSTGATNVLSRAPSDDYVAIAVSPKDLDALERVSASEVGHFAIYGTDQFTGGVEAVVETVLNRVAHKGFQASIQTVIDHPLQFAAINKIGSWTSLPPASSALSAIVQGYLERRVAGAPGRLGGATHFLNPYEASTSAMAKWGKHVKENAVAVFGDDGEKDVHYHGFEPGTALPRPHAIQFGGWSPVFDGRSEVQAAMPKGGFREQLVKTLTDELSYFQNGKKKEDENPYYKRVGEYWQAIGVPYDGKRTDQAWSAAFVSWALLKQGVTDKQFVGYSGHCRYVEDAWEGKLSNPLFEVMHPDLYAPQVGDLVHFGRAASKSFDYSRAKDALLGDTSYSSHADFVVEVDRDTKKIKTIGGNLSNSVRRDTVDIDGDGLLTPRSGGQPYIAVLRLLVS